MSLRTEGERAVAVTDGGRDSSRRLGQERHRILRELRHELDRHPAVEVVRGVPDEEFRELRADLEPSAFERDTEHASLRISWWPGPEDPEFAFHYSESSGFDCGWHREPNPHVEGKTHYQERSGPHEAYEYEPVSLSTTVPSRLVWSILDRLSGRLG